MPGEAQKVAEAVTGPHMSRYRGLASEFKLWLSLGGYGHPRACVHARLPRLLGKQEGTVRRRTRFGCGQRSLGPCLVAAVPWTRFGCRHGPIHGTGATWAAYTERRRSLYQFKLCLDCARARARARACLACPPRLCPHARAHARRPSRLQVTELGRRLILFIYFCSTDLWHAHAMPCRPSELSPSPQSAPTDSEVGQ